MRLLLACYLICLPLKQLQLTSRYGYRVHPVTGRYAFHDGVDLRASRDTVFAIMDGQVAETGFDRFLGLHILLRHNAFFSGYGHLIQLFVVPGEQVYAGEAIAITGSTGRVTGEHLHFSVRYGKVYIDPLKFLYQLIIQQHHE